MSRPDIEWTHQLENTSRHIVRADLEQGRRHQTASSFSSGQLLRLPHENDENFATHVRTFAASGWFLPTFRIQNNENLFVWAKRLFRLDTVDWLPSSLGTVSENRAWRQGLTRRLLLSLECLEHSLTVLEKERDEADRLKRASDATLLRLTQERDTAQKELSAANLSQKTAVAGLQSQIDSANSLAETRLLGLNSSKDKIKELETQLAALQSHKCDHTSCETTKKNLQNRVNKLAQQAGQLAGLQNELLQAQQENLGWNALANSVGLGKKATVKTVQEFITNLRKLASLELFATFLSPGKERTPQEIQLEAFNLFTAQNAALNLANAAMAHRMSFIATGDAATIATIWRNLPTTITSGHTQPTTLAGLNPLIPAGLQFQTTGDVADIPTIWRAVENTGSLPAPSSWEQLNNLVRLMQGAAPAEPPPPATCTHPLTLATTLDQPGNTPWATTYPMVGMLKSLFEPPAGPEIADDATTCNHVTALASRLATPTVTDWEELLAHVRRLKGRGAAPAAGGGIPVAGPVIVSVAKPWESKDFPLFEKEELYWSWRCRVRRITRGRVPTNEEAPRVLEILLASFSGPRLNSFAESANVEQYVRPSIAAPQWAPTRDAFFSAADQHFLPKNFYELSLDAWHKVKARKDQTASQFMNDFQGTLWLVEEAAVHKGVDPPGRQSKTYAFKRALPSHIVGQLNMFHPLWEEGEWTAVRDPVIDYWMNMTWPGQNNAAGPRAMAATPSLKHERDEEEDNAEQDGEVMAAPAAKRPRFGLRRSVRVCDIRWASTVPKKYRGRINYNDDLTPEEVRAVHARRAAVVKEGLCASCRERPDHPNHTTTLTPAKVSAWSGPSGRTALGTTQEENTEYEEDSQADD